MRTYRPTVGFSIRNDEAGLGHFGAPRGTKPDGSKKYHDGVDLVVYPGQEVYSLITGVGEKVDYPYRTDLRWKGFQMNNHLVRVEYWYLEPDVELIGQMVKAGDRIGVAQDITEKYPGQGMTPHIHLRVTLKAFTCIQDGLYISEEIICDPQLFLGG